MRRPDQMLLLLDGFALISRVYMLVEFTALPGDSPVVAVGGTAVLHCRTSTPGELLEVRWFRIRGGIYSMINLFQNGKDQQRCELPEYVGRMELVRDGLAQGRVALKVCNVSVADEGTYRCFLATNYYFDFTDLKLSAKALGSDPRIDLEGFQDGGVKAVCRSAGWYPKPTLVNEDDEGEMAIRQEGNGLYSIEYSRIITENSNWSFSCRLQTVLPHQERESSIHVADGLLQKSTDPTIPIVIAAIAAALVAAVGLAFYLGTRQRNKPGASSPAKPVEELYLNVPLLPDSSGWASTRYEDVEHEARPAPSGHSADLVTKRFFARLPDYGNTDQDTEAEKHRETFPDNLAAFSSGSTAGGPVFNSVTI